MVVARKRSKMALVTGGAGFIGSHLVDELLRRGWRVRVLGPRLPRNLAQTISRLRSDPRRRLELVKGDIRSPKVVRAAVSGVDAVFHLATKNVVPLSFRYPELTNSVNVDGTRVLLENCLEEGVGSFVFTSSALVYGNKKGVRLRPLSPYAESKVSGEKLVRNAVGRGLPACVVRLVQVYGPRQRSSGKHVPIVPKFIESASRGRAIRVRGASQARDLLFVSDAVNALILASEKGRPGGVYDVASGREVPLTVLASRIIRLLGSKSRIQVESASPALTLAGNANVGLTRVRLGFKPRVSLDVGLRKTIDSMASRRK